MATLPLILVRLDVCPQRNHPASPDEPADQYSSSRDESSVLRVLIAKALVGWGGSCPIASLNKAGGEAPPLP